MPNPFFILRRCHYLLHPFFLRPGKPCLRWSFLGVSVLSQSKPVTNANNLGCSGYDKSLHQPRVEGLKARRLHSQKQFSSSGLKSDEQLGAVWKELEGFEGARAAMRINWGWRSGIRSGSTWVCPFLPVVFWMSRSANKGIRGDATDC